MFVPPGFGKAERVVRGQREPPEESGRERSRREHLLSPVSGERSPTVLTCGDRVSAFKSECLSWHLHWMGPALPPGAGDGRPFLGRGDVEVKVASGH